MLIICNGMIRSGSTLQYDMVRTLVEWLQMGHNQGYIGPAALALREADLKAWEEDDQLHVINSHVVVPISRNSDLEGQIESFISIGTFVMWLSLCARNGTFSAMRC